MEINKTIRGFGLITFPDGNGNICTIQESSACRDEALIWFGPQTLNVQVMRGNGWEQLDIRKLPNVTEVCGNERMHLTQSQVKELLPVLTYFVEHGELPSDV